MLQDLIYISLVADIIYSKPWCRRIGGGDMYYVHLYSGRMRSWCRRVRRLDKIFGCGGEKGVDVGGVGGESTEIVVDPGILTDVSKCQEEEERAQCKHTQKSKSNPRPL